MHKPSEEPIRLDQTEIHPTAVIDPGATLGIGVKVGPYAIIGKNVVIGDGATIHPHAVIDGYTTLGNEVEVYPHTAIGLQPQDLKYDGTNTELVVGDRTVLREYVTAQPGSVECGLTKIGDDCLIMAYCHVAHDCIVGNRVIMANMAQLAGHVEVADFVTLGGCTTIHQFVRIGTRAFTGAQTRIHNDVPPFVLADGHPARLFGLNTVGLRRAGFTADQVSVLKKAYRMLFLRNRYKEALEELEGTMAKEHPEVNELCTFLRSGQRGFTRAGRKKSTES